jgi:hypothetical protein
LNYAREHWMKAGENPPVALILCAEELVAEAKRKTGITSDSKLLETALANIVAADDYAEWLFSQRGTVDPALDLEFWDFHPAIAPSIEAGEAPQIPQPRDRSALLFLNRLARPFPKLLLDTTIYIDELQGRLPRDVGVSLRLTWPWRVR